MVCSDEVSSVLDNTENYFLCSPTTFCVGLVFVQILCKARVKGLAQKVRFLSLLDTALSYFLCN
jgi:hypothetical protein